MHKYIPSISRTKDVSVSMENVRVGMLDWGSRSKPITWEVSLRPMRYSSWKLCSGAMIWNVSRGGVAVVVVSGRVVVSVEADDRSVITESTVVVSSKIDIAALVENSVVVVTAIFEVATVVADVASPVVSSFVLVGELDSEAVAVVASTDTTLVSLDWRGLQTLPTAVLAPRAIEHKRAKRILATTNNE